MNIRKLSAEEHGKTRYLYETVFSEDEKAFVDYYYTWKTKDNLIYVAEDEEGIHGMVHLNPFDVWIKGKVQKLHYIVAVATQAEYRHQGIMRRLLAAAEQEMAENGEEFTFLMPASEKIYSPFGYRFFCEQCRGIIGSAASNPCARMLGRDVQNPCAGIIGRDVQNPCVGKQGKEAQPGQMSEVNPAENTKKIICRPLQQQEYGALARVVNETLAAQYDVFIYRDEAYYERLCAEQRCQNGNVMVLVQQMLKGAEQIIGTFCTAQEGCADAATQSPEKRENIIRELIAAAGWEQEVFYGLQQFGAAGLKVEGCNCPELLSQETGEAPYWKPLLMAKVPRGTVWTDRWEKQKIFINEVV